MPILCVLASLVQCFGGASFHEGVSAYKAADYDRAAQAFYQTAIEKPASGTYLNLGLADWQRGKVGQAIVAWERSLWLGPFNEAAKNNLRFARKAAQIEAPDLSWDEVISSWLPVNYWAWIAGVSLWIAVGIAIVPGVLRRPKRTWHQAVAAFGIMIFLLSLPAHLGVYTRSRLGFVLSKQVPLRLTPTAEGQPITTLAAGEPVRYSRSRGNFVLVKTSRATGWLEREQFGWICPPKGNSTISNW